MKLKKEVRAVDTEESSAYIQLQCYNAISHTGDRGQSLQSENLTKKTKEEEEKQEEKQENNFTKVKKELRIKKQINRLKNP